MKRTSSRLPKDVSPAQFAFKKAAKRCGFLEIQKDFEQAARLAICAALVFLATAALGAEPKRIARRSFDVAGIVGYPAGQAEAPGPAPAPAQSAPEAHLETPAAPSDQEGAPAAEQPAAESPGESAAEPMEAPSSLDADLFAEYEDEDTPSIADPLKPWNWVWFQFNDKLHLFILKPVSKGYGAAMPEPARKGLRNFFSNLSFPLRLVSSALQGRMGDAGRETGRFAVNTTLGVLGFGDPAKKWFGWEPAKRDFDQTFAKWGLEKGVYLTWPIFGPSSVRGTFALVGDLALDPATYLPGVSLINIVNSMSLGDDPYQTMREMALDPYVAVRNGYVQYRDKKAEQ